MYKTLNGVSEGLYKEKGSKFIAIARPVSTMEEIDAALAEVRKQYHGARHHCYAWTLGREGSNFRANDDGEPSHSAGDPILGQIRSRDLTNTLVVVVRYFGGTKLGVGGLVQAYRTAASVALDNNSIVTKTIRKALTVHFGYGQTAPVMRLIEETQSEIVSQRYDVSCTIRVAVRERNIQTFLSRIGMIPGVSVQD